MKRLFLFAVTSALFLSVAGQAAPASSAAAQCVVPERIHLSALIFGYSDDMGAVVERLKHESFDAVAASMPNNYAKDVGWFQPAQLSGSQYAGAARLGAGQYAVFDNKTAGKNITRVDEVRPAATCDDAIRAYPVDPWARLYRAAYETRNGDDAAAIADYSKQIESDPKSAGAYLGRAHLYYQEQHLRSALADLVAADNAMPGGTGAQIALLRASIESAMGDDDLAEADASRAYDGLHGNMVDESPAYVARGTAYADLGYYAQAIVQFGMALARHPDDSYALAQRGFARFSLGDDAAAKQDFLRAARGNHAYESPLLDLAVLNYAERNLSLARRYATKAHALAPSDLYASLWLAITQGHPHYFTPQHNSELEPALDEGIRRCETAFYAGLTDAANHRDNAATSLLRTAATACPYREFERAVAMHLLRRRR